MSRFVAAETYKSDGTIIHHDGCRDIWESLARFNNCRDQEREIEEQNQIAPAPVSQVIKHPRRRRKGK